MSNTVLFGKPNSVPELVSFTAINTRPSLDLLSDISVPRSLLAEAKNAPEQSGGSPPATDVTTIPGVALFQAVQGFVNGLGLTSFDSGLSTKRRASVLNSLLFAQLAANGDVSSDPTKNFASQCYSYMPACGFTVIRQSSAAYNAGGLGVNLDKALLDCLQDIATDITSINIMKDVITAIETLPENNGALTLFDHNTIRNGRATVATATVTEPNGATGDIQLVLTVFDFAFSSSETRVLWIKVDDSHSRLNYSTVTFSLVDAAYEAVAGVIEAQVSSFQSSTISNVKLKAL